MKDYLRIVEMLELLNGFLMRIILKMIFPDLLSKTLRLSKLLSNNVFIWKVSQPAQVGSHLILRGSHLGEMKTFHMNMHEQHRVFFNAHVYPADTKTSQRRSKNVLILVSKTSQIGLKWKSRRLFFKTLSRRLPGDVLKTSSRRRPQDVFQETSSRPP